MNEVSVLGALSALVITIIMILCNVPPTYGLLHRCTYVCDHSLNHHRNSRGKHCFFRVHSRIRHFSDCRCCHDPYGYTVFDSMPYGCYFHATGGATMMHTKERLKLLPYEFAVGGSLQLYQAFFCVFKFFSVRIVG